MRTDRLRLLDAVEQIELISRFSQNGRNASSAPHTRSPTGETTPEPIEKLVRKFAPKLPIKYARRVFNFSTNTSLRLSDAKLAAVFVKYQLPGYPGPSAGGWHEPFLPKDVTLYVNHRSRLGAIHCVDDFPHVRFDHWPVHGRERYQRNAAVGEVLFVFERLVARDQNIKPGTFRGVQQSAVFQTAPAHVRDCERIVMREQGPQIMRDIFVQEDLHLNGLVPRTKARTLTIVSIDSVG